MCVPWELDPWPFALLTQCSTTEPQEHSIVWDTFVVFIRISQAGVVCNTSQHANLQGIIWTKHALPNLSLLNLNPENQTTLKLTLFLPRAKNRHATVQNIDTGYLNVFWGVSLLRQAECNTRNVHGSYGHASQSHIPRRATRFPNSVGLEEEQRPSRSQWCNLAYIFGNWFDSHFSLNFTVVPFMEVYNKSLCRPREALVEIQQEYPDDTEHIFIPSCVVLTRCAGCCNDEMMECTPIVTYNITLEVRDP